MTSGKICLRSDLLGTQVVTRDTAKRLGVVSQLWIDVDRREVIAFSLRENLLSGLVSDLPRYMLLDSIYQIGDVILVDDENAITDIDVSRYNALIRNEVITETGEPLGKVYSFMFDIDTGKVTSLIISSLGIPQIPDKVISTYELSMDEVVSGGPDRLIVFEGSEERLEQLTVGVLESLGIGRAPWDRDEDDEYRRPAPIKPENQLGTGVPVRPATQNLRAASPQEAWSEDDWENQQVKPVAIRKTQAANYGQDNWSRAVDRDDYDQDDYNEYEPSEVYAEQQAEPKKAYMAMDDNEDYWEDEKDTKGGKPPQLNIPDRVRTPEYEEENT
jgi:sporulation protein YlmC with PRC-barrel domain